MNIQIVKKYIEQYKRQFEEVHEMEIYKWQGIKQFQDTFNIDEPDFRSNLEVSLSKVGNLMDSGNYFPKRMLLKNALKTPEVVRSLFKDLYNEEVDLLNRVKTFHEAFKALNKKNAVGVNPYQDQRAIMVYLTLRFPEQYFFYKFGMFKGFVEKIEYPYQVAAGKYGNLSHFQSLCELIRDQIAKDQVLLKLHKNRIADDCYFDENLHVLTQDFIYAVVRHLHPVDEPKREQQKQTQITELDASQISLKEEQTDFSPRTINFRQKSLENKRIGDLGEIWVMQYEKEYLTLNGRKDLAEKIKHDAKDQGDGLGYDILSYDLQGNRKYIEVKSTSHSANTTFYISKNELERSRKDSKHFFLYRVYNYDEQTGNANLKIIRGDMTKICAFPNSYRITVQNWEQE